MLTAGTRGKSSVRRCSLPRMPSVRRADALSTLDGWLDVVLPRPISINQVRPGSEWSPNVTAGTTPLCWGRLNNNSSPGCQLCPPTDTHSAHPLSIPMRSFLLLFASLSLLSASVSASRLPTSPRTSLDGTAVLKREVQRRQAKSADVARRMKGGSNRKRLESVSILWPNLSSKVSVKQHACCRAAPQSVRPRLQPGRRTERHHRTSSSEFLISSSVYRRLIDRPSYIAIRTEPSPVGSLLLGSRAASTSTGALAQATKKIPPRMIMRREFARPAPVLIARLTQGQARI